MENNINTQTEVIATYESSRTRRSLVEGNMLNDSNNDEEYESNGFYVREKATSKEPDSTGSSSVLENIPNVSVSDASVDEKSPSNVEPTTKKFVIDTSVNMDETELADNTGKPSVEENPTISSFSNEDSVVEKSEDEHTASTSIENVESSISDESNSEKIGNRKSSDCKAQDTSRKEAADMEVQPTKSVEAPKADSETETCSSTVSCDEGDQSLTGDQGTTQTDATEDKDLTEKRPESSQDKNVDGKGNEAEAIKGDQTESNKTNEVDATKEPKLVDAVDLTLEDATNIDLAKRSSRKSAPKAKGLEKHATGESSEQDMEMDDDFDPSLLCPDISMDVDEAPVVTNESQTSTEGNTSPLPYEPIFSTLVDEITGAEVQVDLTPAEMELRHQMYGANNLVQNSKIHCTACNVHLGSAMIGANNRFVHPLLKVLICKNCYHFYTSGEFEKDEDGSELYCRWCGQGGQVLCCSSCEFVFCKRCIRNNFGVKKFKEIRNSDDWSCFRCHPEQLSSLRASCAEFMEYYRTELARAQSLSSKNPELMTTDYTTCCNATEKKEDSKTPTTLKMRRKRKGEDEDPDYRPISIDEPPLKKPVPALGPGYTIITPNSPRPILPKMAMTRPGVPNTIRPQLPQGQVYRVGNTTFRSKTPGGVLIQRVTPNKDVRNASPGYITIPPSSVVKTTGGVYFQNFAQLRTTTAPIRPQGAYTVVSGTNNGNPTFSTVRATKANQAPVMKHEWFEKTVRAAARVNSNLSYTLTQLNRQQSQAANVEALATVHNKLQEVLSTSINSLIQIRKNLRTEFIAGIKTIKFPPKPAASKPANAPIVLNDDDDVIFINPTSTASQTQGLNTKVQGTLLLSKKVIHKTNAFVNPKPSTSGLNAIKISAVSTAAAPAAPIKGGFLKVRSFTSLQSVPSECITIPDDPPPRKQRDVDPLSFTSEEDPLALPAETVAKSNHAKVVKPSKPKTTEVAVPPLQIDASLVINVKRKQSPLVQKMMGAFVRMERSTDVDRLVMAEATKDNGDS